MKFLFSILLVIGFAFSASAFNGFACYDDSGGFYKTEIVKQDANIVVEMNVMDATVESVGIDTPSYLVQCLQVIVDAPICATPENRVVPTDITNDKATIDLDNSREVYFRFCFWNGNYLAC